MRNRSLRRRIQALERTVSSARPDRQLLVSKALTGCWRPEAEQLLSAFGAEREGRSLNIEEAAAKQAYEEGLLRECRSAGYHSTEGFENEVIREVLVIALAQSMCGEELQLTRCALEAHAKGLGATPEQAVALQKCNAEWIRLSRLAGLEQPPRAT
jgi:hypothetical protein